jgi:hypothetical protein
VKRFGFVKGMAAMQLFSGAVVAAQAAQCAALRASATHAPALAHYAALIPFYGGQGYVAEVNGTVRLSSRRQGSPKPEYAAKVGNSHTLASPELKLWQLAAVVCSLKPHLGKVVVGVCGTAERDRLVRWVAAKQAEPWPGGGGSVGLGSCVQGVDLAVLPCDDMPVHLPYQLLQWAQVQLRVAPHGSSNNSTSSLRSRSSESQAAGVAWDRLDGVYYTEADNVLIMGRGGVGADVKAGVGAAANDDESSSSSSSSPGTRSSNVASGGSAAGFATGVLTAAGVQEMMGLGGGDCFLAPSRFEMKMVSARPVQDDPFRGRILIGQNVCRRDGPPWPVTVQL